MHAALCYSLIVTSCWGQGSVKPKPAWLEMEKDAQAVAIRYLPDAPPPWTSALRPMEGGSGPTAILERHHFVLCQRGACARMVDALKDDWRKALSQSVEAIPPPEFQTVQVYRLGTRLLIPTGELLVTFRKDLPASAQIQFFKDHGLRVADPPVQISPGVYLAQVPADDGVKSVRIAKEISRDQRVVIAEPNLVSAAPRDGL